MSPLRASEEHLGLPERSVGRLSPLRGQYLSAATIRALWPRRSLFAALGASLIALPAWLLKRREEPRFVERTPPGNRYRTFPVGDGQMYVREDLLRSGWYRDLRFHRRQGGR